MKLTKYFISTPRNSASLNLIIAEAEKERDAFLNENKSIVGDIEKEEIQIIATQPHNTVIQAIITLTYFPI